MVSFLFIAAKKINSNTKLSYMGILSLQVWVLEVNWSRKRLFASWQRMHSQVHCRLHQPLLLKFSYDSSELESSLFCSFFLILQYYSLQEFKRCLYGHVYVQYVKHCFHYYPCIVCFSERIWNQWICSYMTKSTWQFQFSHFQQLPSMRFISYAIW